MSDSAQIFRWMDGIKAGKITLDDVPERWREAIYSCLYREILGAAVNVLAARTPDDRRARLGVINSSMRPLVEAEARRIFEARKARKR